MKRYFFYGMLVLSLGIISSCKDETNLAEFRDGTIGQKEYIDHYLLSTLYKPEVMPSEENLREIVSLLAIKKMAVLEAKEQDIPNTKDYKEKLAESERKFLWQMYQQAEFTDAIVTDSLIKKFYNEYSPQYRMAYIMRPFVENSTEEFIQSQKDTIEYVYSLLRSGQKFTDLAKKYSQDITSNHKGGDIGFVINESLGGAKLREVMDSLDQFSTSGPFKGYGGFYIMYKGEKRDVVVPPFEDVKVRIWQTLNRIRGHKIKELANQRFDLLSTKYNYKVDETVMKEIQIAAGETKTNLRSGSVDFSLLTEGELGKTLATFNGGSIKVSDLFENPKKAPINMDEFKRHLKRRAQEHLYSIHAREIGLDDTEKIKIQLLDMENTLLQILIGKKEIKDKAQIKLDSLKVAEMETIDPAKRKSYFQQKYFEIERGIRANFENQLKDKYAFKYITNNFKAALAEATVKKNVQNKEREEKQSK